MIDVEKNIIGSVLMSPEEIVKLNVSAEMFSDPVFGQIYGLCQKWDKDGEEINAVRVVDSIVSDVISRQSANQIIADIIDNHDASTSDEWCCKEIRKRYRAKKLDEILSHTEITADNVDSILEELSQNVDNLKESKNTSVVRMADLVKYQDDYFKDKGNKIYDTGFSGLDKTIGSFDAGDLIIIAGRPAGGKSAFALQLARRYAKKGLQVAFFNLEMTAKQMYERAIASSSGIDMNRVRNALCFLNNEKERFEKGNEKLAEEVNLYLYNGTQRVSDIKAEQLKNKYDVIFIDYLQLVRPETQRANRYQEVGEISRGLKRIAMQFNIPVFALSQLNRVSEQNKDKEPTMSELREAGDLEQDASTILMIWTPNSEERAKKMIKVEKGRQTGNTKQELIFSGKTMTFTEEEEFIDVTEDMDIPF